MIIMSRYICCRRLISLPRVALDGHQVSLLFLCWRVRLIVLKPVLNVSHSLTVFATYHLLTRRPACACWAADLGGITIWILFDLVWIECSSINQCDSGPVIGLSQLDQCNSGPVIVVLLSKHLRKQFWLLYRKNKLWKITFLRIDALSFTLVRYLFFIGNRSWLRHNAHPEQPCDSATVHLCTCIRCELPMIELSYSEILLRLTCYIFCIFRFILAKIGSFHRIQD